MHITLTYSISQTRNHYLTSIINESLFSQNFPLYINKIRSKISTIVLLQIIIYNFFYDNIQNKLIRKPVVFIFIKKDSNLSNYIYQSQRLKRSQLNNNKLSHLPAWRVEKTLSDSEGWRKTRKLFQLWKYKKAYIHSYRESTKLGDCNWSSTLQLAFKLSLDPIKGGPVPLSLSAEKSTICKIFWFVKIGRWVC